MSNEQQKFKNRKPIIRITITFIITMFGLNFNLYKRLKFFNSIQSWVGIHGKQNYNSKTKKVIKKTNYNIK